MKAEMTKPASKASHRREAVRKALKSYRGEILWDAPLAPHTSLKVGGPADALLFPASPEEAAAVTSAVASARLPLFVLGRGSNLLVRDGGIEGVVLAMKRLDRIDRVGETDFSAAAGAPFPKLALRAAEVGLRGLEFAVGIPGTVGGAVAMNAGVPGAETADRLSEIVLADAGGLRTIPAARIAFGYRRAALPKGVIVSARFRLEAGGKGTIDARMRQYLKRRQETQPLQAANCGSVFKNPPGGFAGGLIEACGLKGYRIGDAEVSPRHANFVVNRGGARAADFLALIETMRTAVKRRFGIDLALEVRIVGRAE